MFDFVQKRKIRQVLYNKITLIILAILVLFFLHSTWVVWQKERESQTLKDIALLHESELQERNTELQSDVQRLQTSSGLEAEIRSKFDVAKPGEDMVVVVPDPNQASTSNQNQGILQKIWQMLTK